MIDYSEIDACVDARGNEYFEHDYDEVECWRCGAEPDWEGEDES